MSRLDDLIKSLCPDGVKCYNLGAIAELRSGWGFPVKEQGNKIAEIPFYKVADMNNSLIFMGEASNYVTHETAQKLKCNPAPKGTIIFPKVGATIRTDKKRIIVTDSCYDNNIMGVIAKESIVNSKYLYYYLSKVPLITFAKGEGAVPSISKESLSNFKLPIPPLEVQEEIVRLLDDFTAKTTELQDKLNEELEARKKQYEYYRETVLNDNLDSMTVKIGDVADLKAGATPKTSNPEFWENGTIPWMSSGEVNQGKVTYTEKKITELGYNSSSTKILPSETVVIALAGQGKTRGTVAITQIPLCTNQSLCGICAKDELNSMYLYHYLKSRYEDLRAISNGDGTRGGLNLKMIANYDIPLPPLEVQMKIVNILDKLDSINNDMYSSINNEIKSRQKQYEFYRDKLLTFKESNESEVN